MPTYPLSIKSLDEYQLDTVSGQRLGKSNTVACMQKYKISTYLNFYKNYIDDLIKNLLSPTYSVGQKIRNPYKQKLEYKFE